MASVTPTSPSQLAGLLADYFLHAVRHGYSLRPETLALRSRRHFDGASGLVRKIAHDLHDAETHWMRWSATTLNEWIAASDAFTALVEACGQTQMPTGADEALDASTDEAPDPDSFNGDEAAFYPWLASQPEDEPSYLPFAPTRALPAQNVDSHVALKANALALPPLHDANDLARLLDVSGEEFDDVMRAPRYRLRSIKKANGHPRVLEIPPESLRVLQRRLLHRVLDQVRPHDAAHGFVPGRSVHTHAATHVSRALVIRLDLADFFPSISGARVFLLFRALGYDVHMANLLTAMCVTQQTRAVLRVDMRGASFDQIAAANERFGANHLPQGAPTSPAIANLCAFALDVRLRAWAASFGASYTRYADDLVFSGDAAFAARYRDFIITARAIISAEGWRLNPQKTRVMRASVRQSFTGLVVNERLNVPRDAFDRLKARVHRFATYGNATPDATDECAVLLGHVAWLAQSHPARAAKLRAKVQAAQVAQPLSNTVPS